MKLLIALLVLTISNPSQIVAGVQRVPPPIVEKTGVLYENETWISGYEYSISGNLTVLAGVTLAIDPGVTVTFNQGANLIVNGRLLAEGTAERHITFTKSLSNAGRWGNISFNGTPGSPENRMAYAHIAFNGRKAINCTRASVFFDHLTFGSTDYQYIDLDETSFIISNCHFPAATGYYEMVHANRGIRAGGHGIVVNNYFGPPIGYNDSFDFTGGARPGPIVHFIGNVFAGSSDDLLDIDGTDAWIEGNIFMHCHRNGNTPDSAAAISSGNFSSATSEITIIGNIFYDCDQAATAKQWSFYTMLNNTIVHMTKAGGIDTDDGAITVQDLTPVPTAFGEGFYMEGNVITDVPKLVRYYSPTNGIVTFNNNILPMEWEGPGTNNLVVTNPMLQKIPTLDETQFTNWAAAQVMWDWFSLHPSSPGKDIGPNDQDQGFIPVGASINGTPSGVTTSREANLQVGSNRVGNGINPRFWPEGAGYTHYKWRLDGGDWSAETGISQPIVLEGLANGPHYVEVSGKRDSGLYQDDSRFGPAAKVTRSAAWVVENPGLQIVSIERLSEGVQLRFEGKASTTYEIQSRHSFDEGSGWMKAKEITALVDGVVTTELEEQLDLQRFYRVEQK